MYTERFPYANFHELNLDWILFELKKLIDSQKVQDDQIADLYQKLSDLKDAVDLLGDVDKITVLINNYDIILQQVNDNSTEIATLKTNLGETQQTMIVLVRQMSDLNTQVSDVVRDLATHTNQIDTINTNIDSINSNINSIQQNISSINNDLSGIHSELSTIVNTISAINDTNADQSKDIANLKTEFDTQDTRLGALESDVSGIHTTLASWDSTQGGINTELQNELNSVKSDISTLQNRDSGFDTEINSIKTDLANLHETDAGFTTQLADITERLAGIVQVNNNQQNSINALDARRPYGTNLRDIGFLLDGVTDEADKLAALDPGVYYNDDGTLFLGHTLNIDNKVSIVGTGRYTSVIKIPYNVTIYFNAWGTTLDGLSIISDNSEQPGHESSLIVVFGAMIRNCIFYNHKGRTINISNNSGHFTSISNCQFQGCRICITNSTGNNRNFISNCLTYTTTEYSVFYEDQSGGSILVLNDSAIQDTNYVVVARSTLMLISGCFLDPLVNLYTYDDIENYDTRGLITGNFTSHTFKLPANPNILSRSNSWDSVNGGGGLELSGITLQYTNIGAPPYPTITLYQRQTIDGCTGFMFISEATMVNIPNLRLNFVKNGSNVGDSLSMCLEAITIRYTDDTFKTVNVIGQWDNSRRNYTIGLDTMLIFTNTVKTIFITVNFLL